MGLSFHTSNHQKDVSGHTCISLIWSCSSHVQMPQAAYTYMLPFAGNELIFTTFGDAQSYSWHMQRPAFMKEFFPFWVCRMHMDAPYSIILLQHICSICQIQHRASDRCSIEQMPDVPQSIFQMHPIAYSILLTEWLLVVPSSCDWCAVQKQWTTNIRAYLPITLRYIQKDSCKAVVSLSPPVFPSQHSTSKENIRVQRHFQFHKAQVASLWVTRLGSISEKFG